MAFMKVNVKVGLPLTARTTGGLPGLEFPAQNKAQSQAGEDRHIGALACISQHILLQIHKRLDFRTSRVWSWGIDSRFREVVFHDFRPAEV